MPDMKQYQPLVKNAADVIVGVAQIRVGKSSIRDAATAANGVLSVVPQSTLKTDATNGTTQIVVPTVTPSTVTITTHSITGTYTGTQDGCFILRYNGTTWDIFDPEGNKDAGIGTSTTFTAVSLKHKGGASGLTLSATLAGATSGDTMIIPVWAGTAQDSVQTGIVSPYSPFSGSNESVGGIKSASFNPKVDSTAVLESGFPAVVVDQIITKTSVSISFEAQEYTNAAMGTLRDMISKTINESRLGSVPVEMVCRTRGNKLVSFWIPNCTLASMPTIAPTNDYSSFTWELTGSTLTEVSTGSATYNAWLRNTYIFRELGYIH